jgi:hypothetical protein
MFAKTTKIVTAILIASALAVPGFISAFPAYAQTESASGNVEVEYMTEYPRMEADSENSVTVQTEYRIYRPGDTVRVMGSVSEEMREETESEMVNVQVMDASGSVAGEQQATINGDGEYSTTIQLDSDAEAGEYATASRIEVQAGLLGLLDAEIVAKLESQETTFVVGAESSHNIEAEGGETFDVQITSNSNIADVVLDEEAKELSFTVEGETGTKGVTEVTVPKAMLSGEMMVMIDGEAVSSTSSDIILKSETNADVTFEINYSHSEHTVEVTGTNVVPEFPVVPSVMAAAVGSALVFASRFKRVSGRI